MVADPFVGSRLMIFAACLQEIIPFIDKQWENLTTQTRRTKQTWHATVAKTLVYTQFLLTHYKVKNVIWKIYST